MHGISPAGLEHSLLNGSGQHFIPEVPKVIGNIDQVYRDSAYNWYVDGWACSTGTAASIDVHMYVGRSAGAGSFLLAATANQGSDASLSQQCQAAGSAYRFHIPLPADVRKIMVAKASSSTAFHLWVESTRRLPGLALLLFPQLACGAISRLSNTIATGITP